MRNLKGYIIALSMLLSYAYCSATSDTLRLNLDEAIALAKRQNLSLQSTHIGLERAHKDRSTALGKLFPNIAINGQYGYTLKKQKVYFGSESNSPNNPFSAMMPSDGIEMGQTHNLSTTLNANMPLIAPQLWASLEVDKLSVERALEQVRTSTLGLVSEVRKAYMAVLWAEENIRVLELSIHNMQENLKTIKAKYTKGLVAEYDVIRMESQVSNLKPSLLQAKQQHHLAQMKLLVLMNLEPQQPLVLSDKLQNYQQYIEQADRYTSENLSLEGNSHLRELKLSLRQLSSGIKVKQAEYLPSLVLAFNYSYNFSSDYLKLSNKRRWTPHALVALSLNIPLFSGGTTRKGIASLRLQQEQLRLQQHNTEQQLGLQVKSSQDALRYAREQYQACQEAIQTARKGLDIAQVRYKVGAATLLELNDTELSLRQAQLNQAQAIYNYMISLYTLKELQGE